MIVELLEITCLVMRKPYQKRMRKWFKNHTDPKIQKLWNKFIAEPTFVCRKDDYILYYWGDQCFNENTFLELIDYLGIDYYINKDDFYLASVEYNPTTKKEEVTELGDLEKDPWDSHLCKLGELNEATGTYIIQHTVVSFDADVLNSTYIKHRTKRPAILSNDITDY